MKKLLIAILALAPYVSAVVVAEEKPPDTPLQMFKKFDQGEFYAFPPRNHPIVVSGPRVQISADRAVHSAVLYHQGKLLARHGIQAFNIAFRYLDDDRVYMRIIAVSALQKITGKSPLWYYHGTPGEVFNDDVDWSDRAKAVWKKWKAEQGGADEPKARTER